MTAAEAREATDRVNRDSGLGIIREAIQGAVSRGLYSVCLHQKLPDEAIEILRGEGYDILELANLKSGVYAVEIA